MHTPIAVARPLRRYTVEGPRLQTLRPVRLRSHTPPDIFRCFDHVLWRSNPENTRAQRNEAGHTLKKVAQGGADRGVAATESRWTRCLTADVEMWSPQLQHVGEIA